MDAKVAGDAVTVGGKVRLGVDVGQSVYAVAGQLTINGKVRRNVRAAGGQLERGPKSEIVGNVIATSGHVELGPNARIAGKSMATAPAPITGKLGRLASVFSAGCGHLALSCWPACCSLPFQTFPPSSLARYANVLA